MSEHKRSFSSKFQHDELPQAGDNSSQNQDIKKENLVATTTNESTKAATSLFFYPSSDSVTTRISPNYKSNSSLSDFQTNTTTKYSITQALELDISKHSTTNTTHDLNANKLATHIFMIPDLDTNKKSTTISAEDHLNSLPSVELSTSKIHDSDTNKQANTMTSHGSPECFSIVDPTSNVDSNSLNLNNTNPSIANNDTKQATNQSTDTAYISQPPNEHNNSNMIPTDKSSTSQVLKSYDNKQANMIATNESLKISTAMVPTSNQDSNIVDQTDHATVDSDAKKATNQNNEIVVTELHSNKDDHGNPLPTDESLTSHIPDSNGYKQANMVATNVSPKSSTSMVPTSIQDSYSIDQTNSPKATYHMTYAKSSAKSSISKYQESNVENKTVSILEKKDKKRPILYDKLFNESSICKDIHMRFNNVRSELKLCLLCFSMFPENAIISRRLMVYWWIGEGIISRDDDEAEACANSIFEELIDLDFIEPISRSYGRHVAACKMNALVRVALVMIADRVKFFDFDEYGNPKDFGKFDESRESFKGYDTKEEIKEPQKIPREKGINYTSEKNNSFRKRKITNSYRVCLMDSGISEDIPWEDLHMLFNVYAKNLEFKQEWFLKMKNVNVMFLGRWQSSFTHRIEVEEFEFEKSLDNMNHVRFFSLQGVSRVSKLPDSISKLKHLLILDLRACHNLEVIPRTIGSLNCLIHLDMSGCYLLNTMPKEISFLKSLQVLKGFVVVESPRTDICTLDDLTKLENLRKLHMYTHMKTFPKVKHLDALEKCEVLTKLTILWRGNESLSSTKNYELKKKKSLQSKFKNLLRKNWVEGSMKRMNAFGSSTLGLRLEKLDLRCFPGHQTDWLTAGKFEGLKKLYIRGGNFLDLGQYDQIDLESPPLETWNVEILRLRYLDELDMEWRELQNLFPKLRYLEKVKCSRLTHFPCNVQGVWMKKG